MSFENWLSLLTCVLASSFVVIDVHVVWPTWNWNMPLDGSDLIFIFYLEMKKRELGCSFDQEVLEKPVSPLLASPS
jgi:hypothetical protein